MNWPNWKKILSSIFSRQHIQRQIAVAAPPSFLIHDHLEENNIDELMIVAASTNNVEAIKSLQRKNADRQLSP